MIRTFVYESVRDGAVHRYGVDTNGLSYENEKNPEMAVHARWASITHIKDRSGERVDIWVKGTPAIRIPYGIDGFSELMEAICQGLASSKKSLFQEQTFLSAPAFLFFCTIIMALSAAVLVAGILIEGAVGFVVLALILPLILLLPFQTVGVALTENHLVIQRPFNNRSVPYEDITSVGVTIQRDRYTQFLKLAIDLKHGRDVKLHHLKRTFLLCVMLKIKLNEL